MARDTIAYCLIGLMLLVGASGLFYAWFNAQHRVNQRQRQREAAAHDKVMAKKGLP
jgi:bacteriorhodopsin